MRPRSGTALEAQGLTVTRAADLADVDRAFLSRLRNGQPPPRKKEGRVAGDKRYSRLARVLGLPVGDFLRQIESAQRGGPTELRTALGPMAEAYVRGHSPEIDEREADWGWSLLVAAEQAAESDRQLTELGSLVLAALDRTPVAAAAPKKRGAAKPKYRFDGKKFESRVECGDVAPISDQYWWLERLRDAFTALCADERVTARPERYDACLRLATFFYELTATAAVMHEA